MVVDHSGQVHARASLWMTEDGVAAAGSGGRTILRPSINLQLLAILAPRYLRCFLGGGRMVTMARIKQKPRFFGNNMIWLPDLTLLWTARGCDQLQALENGRVFFIPNRVLDLILHF